MNISFATSYGIFFLILVVLILVFAFITHRVRVHRRQARADLLRSLRAHPAGFGRPRVQEKTRHLDRPGFDWTSDTL